MKFRDSIYTAWGFVGVLVGGVAALPIYTYLRSDLQNGPTLYVLTLATCFAGWGLAILLHALLLNALIRHPRAKNWRQVALVAGVIVAFLLVVGSCTRWKWNECRGVGHGVLYCVNQMGSKR